MTRVVHNIVTFIKQLGLARGIILAFAIVLFLLSTINEMQGQELITASILCIGRNGICVLALLPSIKGGVGLNFGLPLGVLCGLVGLAFSMQFDLMGLSGFMTALIIGMGVGSLVGYGYGILLNKVKGQEMVVGTYVGFASVSIMCLFWLKGPFSNPKMIWAIGGEGLRVTIPLDSYYAGILDNLWSFQIGEVMIPTGLLLFFVLSCTIVSIFFRTKSGMCISADGQNE